MSEEEKKKKLVEQFPQFLPLFRKEHKIEDSVQDDELTESYGEFLLDTITYDVEKLGLKYSDVPAWILFDDEVIIIKNQWLIHFTDDAKSISDNGFIYGVRDPSMLALSSYIPVEKKPGGYNFAFTLDSYDQTYHPRSYSMPAHYQYGDEAVLFRASGVEVYHTGDEQHQVIFEGRMAKDIVPVMSSENHKWAIRNKFTGDVVYGNDSLDKVVEWFMVNHTQYRKVIYNS